jgi:hypothetical protein
LVKIIQKDEEKVKNNNEVITIIILFI